MNKRWIVSSVIGLLATLAVGLGAWAQESGAALFDAGKTSRELEIMKGILETTLDYAARDAKAEPATPRPGRVHMERFFGPNQIGAYYLYGQGAVFTIPASSLSEQLFDRPGGDDFQMAYFEGQAELEETLAEEREEMAELEAERAEAEMDSADAPKAKDMEKAKQKQMEAQAKMQKRVAALQERMRQQQQKMEVQKAKLQALLQKIKVQLVDALANHGDSLSQVRPNEYITLIICPDDHTMGQPQILSVQRGVIVDYKAGRLTLDAFRKKVLDYTN